MAIENQPRCNYCTLQDIRKFAAQTGREVTMAAAPVCERLDPHQTHTPDCQLGTDVFVGGAFVAWLGGIPEHCVCTQFGLVPRVTE